EEQERLQPYFITQKRRSSWRVVLQFIAHHGAAVPAQQSLRKSAHGARAADEDLCGAEQRLVGELTRELRRQCEAGAELQAAAERRIELGVLRVGGVARQMPCVAG